MPKQRRAHSRLVKTGLAASLLVACLAGLPAGAQTADSVVANAAQRRVAHCAPGFVWREANPKDRACAPPSSRSRVAEENRVASGRRAGAGPFGADTCRSGYVWREANLEDHVCVLPSSRDVVAVENSLAASRRAPR